MGDELEVIQTELLGFKALAGDSQVQLTSSWPELPSNSASLLTIAPRKCLVAGAGPDAITIVKTDTVRKAFEAPSEDDSEIRPVEPLVTIPISMRLSQVAFTSDEIYLLVASETGSSVTAYEVDSLIKGDQSSAFEISTSGPLLTMCPNVAVEKAELCAVVTDRGDLHMINTKSKTISNVLVSDVSSVSWSTKGKQLVAGRKDGTIHQLTPEGEIKAQIPCPDGLEGVRVASLQWLENHLFVAIYMTSEETPTSTYFVISRKPPSTYNFSKIGDPVDPFGSEDTPHHSILRLKDFPPNLQDVLVISSTVSPDIGLLTRSKTPLSPDVDATKISGVFTMTEMADDTRRAAVPMKANFNNSVPIGISLDLSARDTVYKPIASEEIDESPGPVPAVWLLNDDGILMAWWLIYDESIKEGTTFPGMVSLLPDLETLAPSKDATPEAAPTPAIAPALAPALVAPTTSAFGAPSTTTSTSTPAFGQPTSIKASPWGSNSSSSAAPAFGQTGFGSLGASSKSPFSSASTSTTSPFGSATKTGGFSSFGNGGGFASLSSGSSGGSIFGQPSDKPLPFASQDTTSTAFKMSGNSSFGLGSGQPFKLQSSFMPSKTDESDDDGVDSDAKPSQNSMFAGFGSALDSDKQGPESAATEGSKKSTFGTASGNFGTASGAFGTPAKTLFGQPVNNGESTATSETKSGFGQPGAGAFDAPKTEDANASNNKEEETSAPQSGFGFAKSSEASTTLFSKRSVGFGAPSQAGGTSMFGAPSTGQTPMFATTKTESQPSSVFGAPAQSMAGASRESIFGAPSTSKPSGNAAPNPFSTLKTPKDDLSSEDDFDEDEDDDEEQVNEEEDDDESDEENDKEEEEEEEEDEEEPESPSPAPKDDKSLFGSPSTPVTKKTAADLLSSPSPTLRKSVAHSKKTLLDRSETLKKTSAKSVAKNLFGNARSAGSSKFEFMSSTPAPPESTSKSTYAIGDSSSGASKMGASDDDTAFSKPKTAPAKKSHNKVLRLDIDDESEEVNDSEDYSGEDAESDSSAVHVSKEVSPSPSGPAHSSGSGLNGSFTMVQKPDESKSIFGSTNFSKSVAAPFTNSKPLFGSAGDKNVNGPVSGFATNFPAPGAQQPVVKPLGSSILAGKDDKTEQNIFLSQQRKTKAKQEAQEAQPLVDEGYDEVQKLLESELQPTLKIDQLIAHTDVAPPAQDSIPAQVEAVYRDINSMVDTVGLNARSVLQFVLGHKQAASQQPCTKEDLESTEEWVLPDLADLAEIIQVELTNDLLSASVANPDEKKAECAELSRNMTRLRSKQKDLQVLLARISPTQTESTRNLPLSPEQAAQQNELRRDFAKFTQHLAAVEESLVLLKTRIASASQALGKAAPGSSSAHTQVPTVDAVMRTIAKMTSMAEKRSGDVDLLEAQVRRLRLSSSSATPTPNSLSASVSSLLALPPTSSSAALMRSSRSLLAASPARDLTASLSGLSLAGSSMTAASTSGLARKKLAAYTMEQRRSALVKKAHKKTVLAKLKTRVEEKGVAVWEVQQGC
ncbi:hypothetical protein TD95_003667 [Thielaviopsis punctulata]|uniref:Nucleoporin Nup159/Nup146 N-terminal domain-containing protein n=1 Tax=Thielaviopsis punctulata TaxID=72032 RepID=A0A0F4ZKR1_9PEZI|nr:hypothetical protein TD95_003667 [Thielaviopsis punctulata]